MGPDRTSTRAARSARTLKTLETDAATKTIKRTAKIDAKSKNPARRSLRTQLQGTNEDEPKAAETFDTCNASDAEHDSDGTRARTSSASPPTTRLSPQKATTARRSATAFTAATGSEDVEMSNGELDTESETSSVVNGTEGKINVQIPTANLHPEDADPIPPRAGERRKRVKNDTGGTVVTLKRRKGRDGPIVVKPPARAKARAAPKAERNTVYGSERTAKLLESKSQKSSAITVNQEASSSHTPIILDDEEHPVGPHNHEGHSSSADNVTGEQPASSPAQRISASDFTTKKQLGAGGFGSVNLVTHDATNTDWALKKISKSHAQKRGCVGETVAEQAILKRLAAENVLYVPTLHSSFTDADNFYLAMSPCSGGTLSQVINNRRGGPDQAAKRLYMAQLAYIVHSIHRLGIVHQDLKSDNVLLTESNYIRLIDFGLAKDFNRTDMQLDGITSGAGTVEYMAPEVIACGKVPKGKPSTPYDHRCDLWSLAVIFYEVTYGVRPFATTTDTLKGKYTTKQIYEAENALLKEMLKINPDERLTTQEIMDHPYFAGINWAEIAAQTFIPPTLVQNRRPHNPRPVPSAEAPAAKEEPNWPMIDVEFYCDNSGKVFEPVAAAVPVTASTPRISGAPIKAAVKKVKSKGEKVVKAATAKVTKVIKKTATKVAATLRPAKSKAAPKATKGGTAAVAKAAPKRKDKK